MNPILKWAGGKRSLLPRLADLYAPYRDRAFVEPFVGGAAAAFGLQPDRVIVNDVNPHLVNFYRQVWCGLTITIEMRNDRSVYDSHRAWFNFLIECRRHETPEAAQLFYYLNRTGFNGLCRFNQQGLFNVPFGKYATITYAQDFQVYTEAMRRRWVVCRGDFTALQKPDDAFIYADPPYDVEFTAYHADGFSWDDQVRCAYWLAAHPGPVVVSNQATPRILELYRSCNFEIDLITMPRKISCNGNRAPAPEILAYRNIYQATLPVQQFAYGGAV